MKFLSTLPEICLVQSFEQPYANAVATARTCYSSKVIGLEDVAKKPELRDKIAKSIYKAGHHTTLQHAHFQFSMKNVSRQVLWSFFHPHPFYNSEQVSQRYVKIKTTNFTIPDCEDTHINKKVSSIFERQSQCYHTLCDMLYPAAEAAFIEVFPAREKKIKDKRWVASIKKRCQEIARYVLPVGTHAHLYHTISALTLYRYRRLALQAGCPSEQQLIIAAMCREVEKIDPQFFNSLEDPIPLEQTHEALTFKNYNQTITDEDKLDFINEFDDVLQAKTSKLISMTENSESILAQNLRLSLGLSKKKISDEAAIEILLDPTQNPYLKESLNLNSLNHFSRALDSVHFQFMKKISHSADSQGQRHRMTPAVRPRLSSMVVPKECDYITPQLFNHPLAKEAKKIYDQEMQQIFSDIDALTKQNVAEEAWQYLLPNSTPIRFIESGSLMHQHHKWTTRLCYNAQEEIWKAILEEIIQVKEKSENIGKWLLPPCGLRHHASLTPYCPEGDRYCGVRVWKQEPKNYLRVL